MEPAWQTTMYTDLYLWLTYYDRLTESEPQPIAIRRSLILDNLYCDILEVWFVFVRRSSGTTSTKVKIPGTLSFPNFSVLGGGLAFVSGMRRRWRRHAFTIPQPRQMPCPIDLPVNRFRDRYDLPLDLVKPAFRDMHVAQPPGWVFTLIRDFFGMRDASVNPTDSIATAARLSISSISQHVC